MLKLFLEPEFRGEDKGDGGIRRVVEAQRRLLNVEFVADFRQADVIACHIAPSKPVLRYVTAHPEIPFVVHIHGAYWGEYEWPSWALDANAELMEACRLADVITVPSEWVAQSIRRNTLRRPVVIGHGVDIDEWIVSGSPEPLLTARHHATVVGPGYVLWNKTRLDPVCDPVALVGLAHAMPGVRFVTTYWPEKGIVPENVTVVGRQGYGEAKELVKNAGVYLCTTRETFGIGTIEAMAAGVPVAGWNYAGQAEIVEHKKTGYMAKVHDMDDLVAGVEWCLAHQKKAGKAASRVARGKYQWTSVMPRYEALYAASLAEKKIVRPKVSVIVPAHGLAKYLPETLDSILSQTFEDWECIVVDDASPDRCGEIAEEYATRDSRIRVLHNDENLHVSGSMNGGMAASKGQYLTSVDADNLIPTDALMTLVQQLDGDRSIDIAYGDVLFVTDDLTPDKSVGAGGHSGWPMMFRADWQLSSGKNLVPSTALCRRRVWELTGGYRRRFRNAEDADFWTRAASYGFRPKKVTEADTLIYRIRDGGSLSRSEKKPDWSMWYPWIHGGVAPAACLLEPQVPIASYEPVLISVVIPVGPGHEELVIDAVDSVDAQRFRLWECIVVNDTGKPLPWLPSWCRVVDTGGGKGVAAARNAGIAIARARRFVPLDADDTLRPDALARLNEVQQQFGGYVYSDWEEVNDGVATVFESMDYDAGKLLTKGAFHAVTALYPVDAWVKVGGFDDSLPCWEDWDFALALANIEVCGTRIPEPLFTYRKDTGTRRDANFGAFDAGKEGILRKWGDYFQGRSELAGCRSCGGGGGGTVTASQAAAGVAAAQTGPPQDGEFLLVEYTGVREGGMVYKGPSGQQYRFAGIPSDRVKMVRKEDGPYFERLSDFVLRRPEMPLHAQDFGLAGAEIPVA